MYQPELDPEVIHSDIKYLLPLLIHMNKLLESVRIRSSKGEQVSETLKHDIRHHLAVLTERCCAISEMGLNIDDPELVAFSEYLIKQHSKK